MIRSFRFVLVLIACAIVCSVLVIRQLTVNQNRHVELREAFILLHSKGYRDEAERLFHRLLVQSDNLSDATLRDDYQRTLALVDPLIDSTNNLIWQYHWLLSNELEKRSESGLKKALDMAREQ